MTAPPLLANPHLVLDLDHPLPDLLADLWQGRPHGARVAPLVRLHGAPLGVLRVDLPCSRNDLAAAVERQLGSAVRDHLADDGLASADSLTAGGLAPRYSRLCGPPVGEAAITVVVTAIAAGAELAGVVRCLEAQRLAPVEIVIVDNRPTTSRLAEFVAGWTGRPLRYVPEGRPGLSHARNAGLDAVHSELVAFSDDDVLLDPGWLEGLVAGFREPDVGCVTGLILPLELETPAQHLIEQFGGFGKGFTARRFDLLADRDESPIYPFNVGIFGSGASTAFRTADLRAIGGFDAHLGTGTPARGGEDLDIFLEILRHGHAIRYEPAAVLWHAHHRELADLRRQVHGYGVGLGAALTKRFVGRPQERRQMLGVLGQGLRHLLDPSSAKNAGKQAGYPPSLTAVELAGLVRGPLAYALSRRGTRSAPQPARPAPAPRQRQPHRRSGTAAPCARRR